MIIPKREITGLSANVRRIIDGQDIDLRDNREGVFSILKNDIYTLSTRLYEQADSLQADKNRLKDTLADISHQIKTPITSMLLMADLLDDDTLPPDKREFVKNIKIELTHLEWLCGALLKFAKLDANAVVFTKELVSAAELVIVALEPLAILLDVKNQSVTTSGDSELFCDKKWTGEALTNIIKNASEHTPDSGTIEIDYGENPICRYISVTDGGAGIPKDELPLLFRRFHSTQKGKGYGIGLPLALAIIKAQNGDIEVVNNECGARFTIKLFK